MNYETMGSSPVGEDCVQVGDPEYWAKYRPELERYKVMLDRRFPVPEGVVARFAIKSFAHDSGSYHEVVLKYDDANECALDFMLHCEGNLPETWDEDAVLPFPMERRSILADDVRDSTPDVAEMEDWMNTGIAEATDGCEVEPDGICPHGCKSWMLEAGYI